MKALFSCFTNKTVLWDSRDLLDTCMSSTARITSWLQSVAIVICTQTLIALDLVVGGMYRCLLQGLL
jgi:hypothetical protein